MKNWIMYLIIGLIALFILFSFTGSRDYSAQTQAQASGGSVSALGNQVGSPSAGVVLTRSQCKATCTGKCGGNYPLIPIGKTAKLRKQCWETCRDTTCAGVNIFE